MADANLQAVLQAHGITASPRQLAEYLAEAVAAMEEGALIPAVRELPEAELEVLLPLFQFQVEERNETRNVKGVVPGIEQVIPALSPELGSGRQQRWSQSQKVREYLCNIADAQPESPCEDRWQCLFRPIPDQVIQDDVVGKVSLRNGFEI